MQFTIAFKIACLLFLISPSGLKPDIQSRHDSIPVRVNDWGKRSLMFAEGFFDPYKNEIVSQLGKDQFEEVKKYSNVWSWPEQMKMHPKQQRDSLKKANYRMKMGQLKLYQIASFSRFVDGKEVDKWVILNVPYEENKDWDKTAQWQKCYFIVDAKAIAKI